jgi:hypothetical protein
MNSRSIILQNYQSELDQLKKLDLMHGGNAPKSLLQGSNAKSPVAATLGLSLDEI